MATIKNYDYKWSQQDVIDALKTKDSKLRITVPAGTLAYPYLRTPKVKAQRGIEKARYQTHVMIPSSHRKVGSCEFLWNLLLATDRLRKSLKDNEPPVIMTLEQWLFPADDVNNEVAARHNDFVKQKLNEGFELVVRARTAAFTEDKPLPPTPLFYMKGTERKPIEEHPSFTEEDLKKISTGTVGHVSAILHHYNVGKAGLACYLNAIVLDTNRIEFKNDNDGFGSLDAFGDLASFDSSFVSTSKSVETEIDGIDLDDLKL